MGSHFPWAFSVNSALHGAEVLVLVIIVIVAVVLATYVGLRLDRRRRTPSELRGDWWTRFENEFRAYAARMEQSRRPRRQRWNDHGSIGQ